MFIYCPFFQEGFKTWRDFLYTLGIWHTDLVLFHATIVEPLKWLLSDDPVQRIKVTRKHMEDISMHSPILFRLMGNYARAEMKQGDFNCIRHRMPTCLIEILLVMLAFVDTQLPWGN